MPKNKPIEKIQFKLHPRVFSALGTELVTNDTVAIVELVKNSYDAFATRVDLRLKEDKSTGRQILEIEDNGTGMTREVIENAWCVVATPYRVNNFSATKGKKTRRVSGEKGLGRLSAARLGNRLELITRSENGRCWRINVNWGLLANASDLNDCQVEIEELSKDSYMSPHGTLLRISEIENSWTEDTQKNLAIQLGRLIYPFADINDFEIWLDAPGEGTRSTKIEPHKFLFQPPYAIKGKVDKRGMLHAEYQYIDNERRRENNIKLDIWKRMHPRSNIEKLKDFSKSSGPFDFEIRAWDLDADAVLDLSKRFEVSKKIIREDISAFKGVSVYRDGILVLPKSETRRDWLGLDLRRVSKVGSRFSTSQIVGYVAITAEQNPNIEDTSDRERLKETTASDDFIKLLKEIFEIFEKEREIDRRKYKPEPPLKDLFERLSYKSLIEEMRAKAKENVPLAEIIKFVEVQEAEYENNRKQLEKRILHYHYLASLGTIAGMLVHEVRNRSTSFSKLFETFGEFIRGESSKEKVERDINTAQKASQLLLQLANRFAPLANRNYRSGEKGSCLEEIIQDCINLREDELSSGKIRVSFESKLNGKTLVSMNEAELSTLILNLLDNAWYWLSTSKDIAERHILFEIRRKDTSKIFVGIHDNGPGINPEEKEEIFLPGVTRKPGGIGFGLTISAEIVSQHGGKLELLLPSKLGGASFVFELPPQVVKESKSIPK